MNNERRRNTCARTHTHNPQPKTRERTTDQSNESKAAALAKKPTGAGDESRSLPPWNSLSGPQAAPQVGDHLSTDVHPLVILYSYRGRGMPLRILRFSAFPDLARSVQH